MNKLVIAVAALVVVGVVGYVSLSNDEADNAPKASKAGGDSVGTAVVNTALSVSGLDVSALSDITEKLEASCARNKFGLSEAACIQAIRERKDVCAQQTAQKYPGQLSDVNRLQEVVSSYVDCLFQR